MSVPSHNGKRSVEAYTVPKNFRRKPDDPADHVRVVVRDENGYIRGSATLTPNAAIALATELVDAYKSLPPEVLDA